MARKQRKITRSDKQEASHKAPKLEAKTPQQSRFMQCLDAFSTTIVTGPAGTGKTYISAAKAALSGKNIVIIRPNISCGKTLGFMPGEKDEKMLPWAAPVLNILNQFLGKSQVEYMLKVGKLELLPLEHVRGRTFDNSFVIVDEAQNTTPDEMKAILTRHGKYTTMVIDGDIQQKDLKGDSGLDYVIRLGPLVDYPVGFVDFGLADIQRSEEARAWLMAMDKLGE